MNIKTVILSVCIFIPSLKAMDDNSTKQLSNITNALQKACLNSVVATATPSNQAVPKCGCNKRIQQVIANFDKLFYTSDDPKTIGFELVTHKAKLLDNYSQPIVDIILMIQRHGCWKIANQGDKDSPVTLLNYLLVKSDQLKCTKNLLLGKNQFGEDALWWAVIAGQLKCVQLFIDALKQCTTSDELTKILTIDTPSNKPAYPVASPLRRAQEDGRMEIVAVIRKAMLPDGNPPKPKVLPDGHPPKPATVPDGYPPKPKTLPDSHPPKP